MKKSAHLWVRTSVRDQAKKLQAVREVFLTLYILTFHSVEGIELLALALVVLQFSVKNKHPREANLKL